MYVRAIAPIVVRDAADRVGERAEPVREFTDQTCVVSGSDRAGDGSGLAPESQTLRP
jgi:hypothetical protein